MYTWGGVWQSWYLSFWYWLLRRHLPPGSLPAIIFSVMLMFFWETHLPWIKEPDGSAAPHSSLGLVEMNSCVAEEKGLELLYPRLQALGKIMRNFFGFWASSCRGASFSRISSFTYDELSDPSFGKEKVVLLLVNIFLCCQKTWSLPKLFTQDCVCV